jgi:hypothetical protein
MNKPAELVWIYGKRTKVTHRSQTIHTLDKNDSLRVAIIPSVHIHAEEKVVGADEYRYLVPQWWAHQNKIKWSSTHPLIGNKVMAVGAVKPTEVHEDCRDIIFNNEERFAVLDTNDAEASSATRDYVDQD